MTDHESIVNALTRIQSAWVEGRTKELPALFHPDIVLVFPGFSGAARGRRAAVATFEDFLREAEPIGYNERDVHVDVAGDTATATYTFELLYRRHGRRFRSTGRDLWVFSRHGGDWLATWRTLLDASDNDIGPAGRTRSHTREVTVAASPERTFDALLTPSSIRAWWGASSAAVIPEEGGPWVATWGADEDLRDYITAATIEVLDRPNTLRLGSLRYLAKEGPLPFEAAMRIEFTVRPAPAGGSILRVEQSGFPTDIVADDFYAACELGWKETLEGFRRWIER